GRRKIRSGRAQPDADHRFADFDFISAVDRPLVDPLAVDESAFRAAHVNDRQLAAGGDFDHRVNAGDLLVIQLQMGGSEPADLDDLPIVFLGGDQLIASVHLESNRYRHEELLTQRSALTCDLPPYSSPTDSITLSLNSSRILIKFECFTRFRASTYSPS